jgi:sarcosine oxidase subunit gamma
MSDTHSPKAIAESNLQITPAAKLCRWSVRVRAADRFFLESLLSLPLPVQPLRSFQMEHGSALWLGPDEWLVLMRPEAAQRFRERYASLDASATPPASVVEVTHRNVGIELRGTYARWIINSGCPLDLSPQAFGPGACTRTLFGKTEIALWRHSESEPRYHLEFWRSYAPHVWTQLRQAAAECVAEHRGPVGAL